jgi:hypothetical protein
VHSPGHPFSLAGNYPNSSRSARGGVGAWRVTESGSFEVWISVPASCLTQIPQRDLFHFIHHAITVLNSKILRIDICIDDYLKQIDPQLMIDAFDSGNISGFQSIDPRFPRGSRGAYKGFCLYFGHPKSDKRIRYYDKSYESSGVIDSYRLELQLRRDSAHNACLLLSQIKPSDFDDLYGQFLTGILLGSFDFIDRSDCSRASRCPRLVWWDSFCSRIVSEKIKVPARKKMVSLSRTIAWFKRQVSTSFALFSLLLDRTFPQWIEFELASGMRRFKATHYSLYSVGLRDCEEIRKLLFEC